MKSRPKLGPKTQKKWFDYISFGTGDSSSSGTMSKEQEGNNVHLATAFKQWSSAFTYFLKKVALLVFIALIVRIVITLLLLS